MTDHPDTDLTDPHGEAERLRLDLRHVIAERDATFALMLARADKAELERDHWREAYEKAALQLLGSAGAHGESHGEAEALRRENADLRRINQNLRQIERNVQAERERQFRRAEAAEAALAAIRAPDPVVNAGSCQPGDLISRAAAIELLPCPFCGGDASADGYIKYGRPLMDTWWEDGSEITEAFFCNCPSCGIRNVVGQIGYQSRDDAIAAWNRRAIPAAPVADAQTVAWRWETTSEHIARDMREGRFPEQSERQRVIDTQPEQPTIGGAELDALVGRLRQIGLCGFQTWADQAADAITALREKLALAVSLADERDTLVDETITLNKLVIDWKVMAERLGEVDEC